MERKRGVQERGFIETLGRRVRSGGGVGRVPDGTENEPGSVVVGCLGGLTPRRGGEERDITAVS